MEDEDYIAPDESDTIPAKLGKAFVYFLAIIVGISMVMGAFAWLIWFARTLWGWLF